MSYINISRSVNYKIIWNIKLISVDPIPFPPATVVLIASGVHFEYDNSLGQKHNIFMLSTNRFG
jgi:hypothetical protein